MGFARSLLLKASRSQWLARQLRERRFFQRAVKRFMPGETLEAALEAANQFAKAGLGTVLTELGERSEEHTSELQSRLHLVCRLLLEKKKKYISLSLHTHNTGRQQDESTR